MQLAFSTLGCPEWTFAQVIEHAKRLGYAGIEFRGLQGEIELPQVPEFSPTCIASTHKRLRDAGLRAACMSSSVAVAFTGDEADRHMAVATVESYIEMAREMEAPYVRLFGGKPPVDLLPAEATDRAVGMLRRIGDFAQPRGTTVVMETHDAFVESSKLADLIRLTNHPAIKVLWDIHHPYRIAGEGIPATMHNLKDLIYYTHVKDSVLNDDGEHHRYMLVGHGDVPLKEALHALKDCNYDGFLTLEWEKRWVPDLEPPEIAFPQYIEQMNAWLAEL